jgi:exosortase K
MTAPSVVSGVALPPRARALLGNAAPLAAVLAVAYGLKRFYSSAGADELGWLLEPTAQIVSFVSGHAFVEERGSGYLSRELGVLIAPSCAGGNYLIVAFVMTGACFLPRFRKASSKWSWIGVSAVTAYLATLCVNALRILLTLAMKSQDTFRFGLSFGQLHRIEGVLVYLGSLWLLYLCLEKAFVHTGSGFVPRARQVAVPWLLYVGVTLGVPLLNGAGHSASYASHACTVLLVSSATAACVALLCYMLRRRRPPSDFVDVRLSAP